MDINYKKALALRKKKRKCYATMKLMKNPDHIEKVKKIIEKVNTELLKIF
jgi:hypothetical protein